MKNLKTKSHIDFSRIIFNKTIFIHFPNYSLIYEELLYVNSF